MAVNLDFGTGLEKPTGNFSLESRLKLHFKLDDFGRRCCKTCRYMNLLRIAPDDFVYHRCSQRGSDLSCSIFGRQNMNVKGGKEISTPGEE